jgi:hypothetical protein
MCWRKVADEGEHVLNADTSIRVSVAYAHAIHEAPQNAGEHVLNAHASSRLSVAYPGAHAMHEAQH